MSVGSIPSMKTFERFQSRKMAVTQWRVIFENGRWFQNLIPCHWRRGFDQQYRCRNSFLCLQEGIHRLRTSVMILEQLEIAFLYHLLHSWTTDFRRQTKKYWWKATFWFKMVVPKRPVFWRPRFKRFVDPWMSKIWVNFEQLRIS